MDAYLDQLALETAQAIRLLEWRVFPGGPAQRDAAVQVLVREALEKARRDARVGEPKPALKSEFPLFE